MLAHLSERFVKVVEALPVEALNWQPTSTETNSIAQIVRHVTFGQGLILSRARGEAITGPLDARTRGLHNDPATHAELLGLLARMDEERAVHLTQLDALVLTEQVPGPPDRPTTRLFWLVHSVGEAREHLGHAELTQQLWGQRG
jgi:hypothetical protein